VTRAKVKAGGIIRKSLDNSWQTPPEVLDRVRAYFGGEIPFDPATAPNNPTRSLRFCAGPSGTMFAREDLASKNGLEVSWDWPTWVNPPYGENLRDWLAKIGAEAARGTEIIALIPASRWETSYFPPVLALARVVCFHRGRIAFISSIDGQPVAGNPGASMFLGWNVNLDRFVEAFTPLGPCFWLRALRTEGVVA
jgi:hypothetical protein